MVSTAKLCLLCKGGRALCGHSPCPLLARINIKPKIEKLSTKFFGPAPGIFVGHTGYPIVSVGPLGALEVRRDIDDPSTWLSLGYSEIIELRSLLLRSKVSQHVKSKNKFVRENQELALAAKPTDIELKFKKKPIYQMSFSEVHQPMGPSAQLEKLQLAENPKIPFQIEKIVNDELKANEVMSLLYQRGIDVYKLATILSSGILGSEQRQKLVPTRWSITAVDDIITKQMLEKIRQFPSVNGFLVFSAQHLDNHFEILLMPGNWEYENFEAWAPGSFWSQSLREPYVVAEYEPFRGRTKYAELEAGGYYAARLGVVEGLLRLKRQARVVVFREVYEGYTIPLGVWVVREVVRTAMKNKPVKFLTQKEALDHISSKLKLPIKRYISQSKILRQRRLTDFY